MALVNPQIAMSYRPTTEYQPRNALAEYAQIQSIVGGQRQAEAAEMQLESLRRERDALGQIQAAITAKGGPPDLAAAADAMIKTGKPEYLTQGMAIRTALENQRKAAQYFKDLEPPTAAPANAMTAPASQGELVAEPIRPIPSPITAPAAADAPAPAGETNLAYLQRQFGTPGAPVPAPANALAPAAAAAAPVNAMAAPDAMMVQRQALEARLRRIGNNPELKAEREMLLKQYESLLAGAAPPADVRTMQLLGFPATTEGYRQYRAAQMAPPQPRAPVAVLQNGRPVYVSPEQAVGQTPFTPASVQVLGMGPGREPPAPTITQIQDPTDPTRMITIDARRYQGGGVGAPGVIGASGKTPAATAAAMKKEEGATQAKDILDTLRTAYDTLDQARAVPSQQRNALSNALSYVAGTGVGQVAGRVVGTEAQTQRDIIASARNQMLNAIKNATGMSAQQLNSNVEFRSWLEALTDPTRSIEANRAILDNMEKFIASGGKYSAKGGGQAAPAAAPAGGATGGWSVVR